MEAAILKTEFAFNVYNDLSSVEDANQQVNRNDHEDKADFLKRSFYLLEKYALRDKLGIRLLHKHNGIESNERMIESKGNINGERALVTDPIKNVIGDKAIPSVWTIVDGNFCPLEFTTDPLARQIFGSLEIPAGFLVEYRDQVNSSPIGKYLGISVVERGFFRTDDPDSFPLEYSDQETRSNAIFLRDRSKVNKAIETAWSFRRDIDIKLGCDSKSYCTSACTIGCQSVEGGHEKFHMGRHHHVSYEHTYV